MGQQDCVPGGGSRGETCLLQLETAHVPGRRPHSDLAVTITSPSFLALIPNLSIFCNVNRLRGF